MHRLRHVPLLALAVAGLVGCAPAGDAPDASAGSSATPSATPSESASPTLAPEPSAEPWQTVTVEDGTTWSMPADWTTLDESSENEGGRVVDVRVLDADGTPVLAYFHDLGGLGGIGGGCTETPAMSVLAQTPSAAGFQPMADEAFFDAAYAVEQADGSVALTIGVIPDAMLEAEATCLLYNIGYDADLRTVSFATAFSSGLGLPTDASQDWSRFGSFDEASSFVASAAGQTMLQVVASLRLAS